MSEIGIRELKQRASQILREVREKGEIYTVTYRGKPCGVLVPHPTVGTKKKGKRKGAKAVSLRGIWKDGPHITWEEFQAAKKIWTQRLDYLAAELIEGSGDEKAGG